MSTDTLRMQQNFGRAAARYDAHAALQQRQVARVLGLAERYAANPVQVLDVGCGTGQFSAFARPHHPRWRVTGLDRAEPMLRMARPRCHAVLQADAAHLPLAGATQDLIVSSLCMQWVDDKPAMLAEIRRVLRPGGVAVLATLGDGTLRELRAADAAAGTGLGLLPMLPFAHYETLARASGMALRHAERTEEHDDYPSLPALLHAMRAIGAGHAGARRFIGRQGFARLERHYRARHDTIRATWEPILLVMERA